MKEIIGIRRSGTPAWGKINWTFVVFKQDFEIKKSIVAFRYIITLAATSPKQKYDYSKHVGLLFSSTSAWIWKKKSAHFFFLYKLKGEACSCRGFLPRQRLFST